MRLSRPQLVARARIDDAIARNLRLDRLGTEIAEALSVAVPNDGFRLLGIDHETLLVNRLIAASDNDDWARSEWLREIYLRGDTLPYVEIHEQMRLGLKATAIHERQSETFGFPRQVLEPVDPSRHTEAFHELRSPTGGTLFGSFPSRGRWVAAVQIYRRDGAPNFRRTDVAFVQSMSGRIGEAIATGLHRDQILGGDPGGDAPSTGVVVLDLSGRRVFQTKAGDRWLSAVGASGASLPEAVHAALASARSNPDGTGAVSADTEFGPVRIEASTGDASGSIALVFTPAAPANVSIPRSWELTAAESRVVELAVKGITTSQIADQLFISPETARTHLRHVYEKLSISSRNQLMARVFRAGLPGEDERLDP